LVGDVIDSLANRLEAGQREIEVRTWRAWTRSVASWRPAAGCCSAARCSRWRLHPARGTIQAHFTDGGPGAGGTAREIRRSVLPSGTHEILDDDAGMDDLCLS
jgi:hypothetical protein